MTVKVYHTPNIRTEVTTTGDLWKDKNRHRKASAAILRDETSGDKRSGRMPRSHLNAGEHPAEFERVAVYGVSEGKEFTDDIRPTCKSEVQVWELTLLVSRVLCRYSGTK